jgi:hypothetical protein
MRRNNLLVGLAVEEQRVQADIRTHLIPAKHFVQDTPLDPDNAVADRFVTGQVIKCQRRQYNQSELHAVG